MNLNLSADQVLATTRAVRKRLDLDRPVDPADIRECLDLALQAPTGSNRQNWHFVVVTDRDKIEQLGDLYRRATIIARQQVSALSRIVPADAATYEEQSQRVYASAEYLMEMIHRVPAMLIPCIDGNPSEPRGAAMFSLIGSVVPAVWSFMLAARNRGIGTVWTTVHLALEAEAAQLLSIPYPQMMQVALIPFGYTRGTDFKPARREPQDLVVHWNGW